MLLDYKTTISLLKKYNLSTPNHKNFPKALKVHSPQILHKTEYGLVFLNIKSDKEMNERKEEAKKILSKKEISEFTFIEQEMIKGLELIFGMKKDNIFGPVIVFGIGGIFVEVFGDISMRLAPLTRKDCIEMVDEIKGKKLLEGYRGAKTIKKEILYDLLMKLSNLSMKENKLLEIDFNPVIVTDKKAYITDARIIC